MSYAQTYQERNNSSTSTNESIATPLEKVYQLTFIRFVYDEVVKATEKRSKNDPPRFDLDSKEILINAQKLADEKLRMGVLI